MLNAIDVFRSIESLPFARHSSELFDRPSINLGRIWGGDALNKVPDRCVIDVDIRYLPDQDPNAMLAEVRALPGVEAKSLLTRPPATVDRNSPFVRGLREAAAAHHEGEPMSVGRDGASDAVSFLRVGVPAVEFGPVGAGHHGPEEWVSVSSLETYRQALDSFLRAIPTGLAMTEAAGPGWAAKKPPPSGDSEPPPKPKRYWLRFTLASVLIVAVSAAATATSVLLYLYSFAEALSHNNVYSNKVRRYLSRSTAASRRTSSSSAPTSGPGRFGRPGPLGHDDAAPARPRCNAIAVFSIPRDLKVEIPGYGTEKFNDAYTYGGPKLTLQTVKQLTGPPINHVVNVDFLGFARAVDAIGCVYVDVDRRYFHSNDGVPPSEHYAEINIQPGYQALCGFNALEYVRYRHTDNDIVRAARQQDFLRRAPAGPAQACSSASRA